jgi:hypothetical protein
MVDEVTPMLDIIHGSSNHITHNVLQFHKVSARWVPRQLLFDLEEGGVVASQSPFNDMKQKLTYFCSA